MSQYIKLLQHNGGFISVLADDNGVIQYTTNDADYDGIPSEGGVAATADLPTNAATFTAALNPATNLLKGLLPTNEYSGLNKAGAALTDASVTINPTTLKISKSILQDGVITANRVLTLDNTGGAITTQIYNVVVLDTSAFTYSIFNDQGGGYVHPANGVHMLYRFYFDGTRFVPVGVWFTN